MPILAAAACLAAPALAGPPDLEGKMYVITDWSGSDSDNYCEGRDVEAWAEMLDGWYDAVNDYGKVFKDGRMVNGDMKATIFCDPDSRAGCNDVARLDDADVAMIGLHGIDRGEHWAGLMRTPWQSRCRVDAPERLVGPDDELVQLGDTDLEFFHMSSCESMNDEHWDNTRLMFSDGGSSNRLHIATGFHGVMWISSGRDDDYEDFALDGHFALASAWTDHLYDDGIGDGNYEQCPVAMSVGSSSNACAVRLATEGYLVPQNPDPGGVNWYCTSYYDGCDPKAETPLTPPWED